MTIGEMAAEVAGLMQDRLRIGGEGLAAKLRRGAKLLPRDIRRQAEYLAQAERMAGAPKLFHQLDQARIDQAHAACVAHLYPIGRAERRWSVFMSIVVRLAFAIIAVFALLVSVLVWRGYL